MAALSIAPSDIFSEWWDRYNQLVDAQIASIAVVGTVMRFTYTDASITDVPLPTPATPASTGLQTASNGLSVTGTAVKLGGTVTAATTLQMQGTATNIGINGVGTGAISASEVGFGITNGAAASADISMFDTSSENEAHVKVGQADGATAPYAQIRAALEDGAPTPPASYQAYVRTQMETGVGKVKIFGKTFVNSVPFEAGRVTSVVIPALYDELDPLPGDLIVFTGSSNLDVAVITGRVGALLYVNNMSSVSQPLAFLKFEGNISTTSIDTILSGRSRIYAYASDTIGWVRLNYY